nr:hypothetical protein [Tanacetum cinerariifolium]
MANLKKAEEESEKILKKKLTPATYKALALKREEHEAKKAKMLEEYNSIFQRADSLQITNISYTVDSHKNATMRITRGNDPLNLTVYPNLRLKMLSFSEWIEVQALASKKKDKSIDLLLQCLKAKFQWVLNQAKKVGLPPPSELATFRMIIEDKKQKRTEFLKEIFVTEDVYGMNKNLIPPRWITPIDGLVINEPESGIFFMNRNTDVAFQRESEFHMTPTGANQYSEPNQG